MQAHRSNEALTMLQEGVTEYPQSSNMHLELGNALSLCSQYPESIKEYQIALKLQPDLSEALLNIAYVYCNAGQSAKAIPWFQRFLKEHHDSPKATQVEAQMLTAAATDCMEHEKVYDAKKMLEHACQMSPQDLQARFKLARARDELGDTQGAIADYQKVLEIQPNHAGAIFNIAGCYQSMGRTQEAIQWFQQYLQVMPDAPEAVTVRNMIAKLQEKSTEPQSDPHAPDYADTTLRNNKITRWPLQRFPLRVWIEAGAGVPGYRDSFGQALYDSFTAWAQASQGRLLFTQVQNPNIADILCSWTGNPFDVRQTGSNVEQGICQLHTAERLSDPVIQIERANIRILTVDREKQKPLSDDDMKKTCLHELGHALGLNGHSNNNHDIMFFSVSPTVWPVLSKRDKATILRIYQDYPPLQSN